jgi:NitT/TauT family transport system substrate-binding protein
MPTTQTRRGFLTTLSFTGAASLVRPPRSLAAEGALETTTVRLAKNEGICIAPQYIADELLRAEGFTDIRYVFVPQSTTRVRALADGQADFSANFDGASNRGRGFGRADHRLGGLACRLL